MYVECGTHRSEMHDLLNSYYLREKLEERNLGKPKTLSYLEYSMV